MCFTLQENANSTLIVGVESIRSVLIVRTAYLNGPLSVSELHETVASNTLAPMMATIKAKYDFLGEMLDFLEPSLCRLQQWEAVDG